MKFKNNKLTNLNGNFYLSSRLTYNFKQKPTLENIIFNGVVISDNIGCQYEKYKVKKVFSKILFNNKSIELDVHTTSKSDINFRAKGVINNLSSSPKLKLEGTVSNLKLSNIQNFLPFKLSGDLSSEFKIIKGKNITEIEAQITSFKTNIENTSFDNLYGFLLYKNGTIEIKNLKGISKDSYVKVAGYIDCNNIRDISYIFSAKLNNLKISKEVLKKVNIPDFIKLKKLNGNIFLAKSSKDMVGFGNLKTKDLQFKNLTFEESNINFSLNEANITLKYIGLSNNYLAFSSGKITKNKFLDFNLSLTNIPAQSIASLVNINYSSGNLNFDGKISGPVNNPTILGKLESNKLNLSGITIKSLNSNLTYHQKNLTLNPISFFTSEDIQTASFKYDVITKDINLIFTLNEFPLEPIYRNELFQKLLKFDNNEIEGGFLTGKVYASGKIKAPELKGNVHIKNIKFYKKPIKWLESHFEYNKFLSLDGIVNLGDIGAVSYKGLFSNESGLKFTFNSNKLELSKYFDEKQKKYLVLPVQVSGEINGTLKEPKIFTQINSNSIKINRCQFDSLNSFIEYKDNFLSIANFILRKGDETLSIKGQYDLLTSSLNISMSLSHFSLESLSAMHFNSPLRNSEGKIEGEVKLWGPINHLNGDIFISANKLTLESYPLEKLVFNASLEDNVIKISELNAYNQITTIEASGDFSPTGSTNLNVNIRNAELKILNDLNRKLPLLTGFIDANLQVYKDELSERIIGTSTLSDFSIQNITFEKSRIELEVINNQIFVKGKFLKGKQRVEVESIIPTFWKEHNDLSEAELIAKSDKLDAAILNPILEKYKINISGESEFNLHFKNILNNFTISEKSKIKLNNICLSSEISNLPISNVYGQIFSSKDETLIIEHLTGTIGGSSFNVSGWAQFNKFTLSKYNINFTGKSIPIHYKDFLRATANIDLTIEEKDNKSILRGNIYCLKSEFTIPQLKKQEQHSFLKTIGNWESNITIVLKDDFKVKNSSGDLVAYPYGNLILKGTISNPEIVGTLKCENGYFSLYDSLFTLTKEAELKFDRIEKTLIPNISVFAETKSKTFIDGKLIDLTIFIHIHGKLDGKSESLKMELSSSPIIPGGESEIFKILTHGQRIDEIFAGKNLKDILLEEASNLVIFAGIKPLRKKILEKIDIQNFEMRVDPNKNIIVEIDKKLTDKLFLSWFHIFSKEEENELELKYKIREKNYLKWKIDKFNKQTYEIEYLFEF